MAAAVALPSEFAELGSSLHVGHSLVSEPVAAVGASVGTGGLTARAPYSARFNYPRSRALGSAREGARIDRPLSGGGLSAAAGSIFTATAQEDFDRFRHRTLPSQEDVKENVFDKSTVDPFRHDARFTGGHITIAPPEEKLELALKDRRQRPLPSALRPAALDILEKPLRCLDRTGMAPPGHPSDEFYNAAAARAPPQPIPATTQKHETEFVECVEKSLKEGQIEASIWDQYAKRAEELLITMPLEKILRVLKAFVLARYRGAALYTHIGTELAKEIKNASSTRLCQIYHWIGRAGLRDQTLMALMGNETLLRLSDDFVLDMYIEVLNVHAKLDLRSGSQRLLNALQRDMLPLFQEFGRDQCCAVAPLAVMNIFSDQARVAYLKRCAELSIGLPVRMTKPAVLRQFRLLEDALRLDYHPTSLPNDVQHWLSSLKTEADSLDVMEPTPLSVIEQDILRVLREEMDVAVTPIVQDGIFTLHLVMGKSIIEVLDGYADYYTVAAMGGHQRLLRADTKLRHKLLWRRGWRLLTLDEQDWTKLTDDLYKKDLLEDLLVNGPRRFRYP
eukprot:TRINITY_DN80816_c0_g1_i1.p1 TRINITY_DN80816_c0_g1~~TRINITY_DN80816_c0_g1_i1.p1  ORF type:complete len:580 (+),score=147.95 TRINITY_DN80816_c0_g1_i1:57-1742(+)